jgi:hypothetical protein
MHVLRAGDQARLALELPVRREGKPEAFKIVRGVKGSQKLSRSFGAVVSALMRGLL